MKIATFTCCDERNLPYAKKLIKSFKYFHPDIDFVLFTSALVGELEGVRILPLGTKDPDIWYKQKPYFADKLFNEGYESVLGMDSDQLVLGKLDYLFDSVDYDIGTVLNFNPLDFRTYGEITIQGVHGTTEYYNCGLVMMRSHKLVKHWLELCNSKFFKRFKYREQDLLNIIAHFGEYKVKCFDDADDINGYYCWHGLLGSRETLKMKMVGEDVVLPKSDDLFPSRDIIYKVYHAGNGQTGYDKLNYRTLFEEEIVDYIDKILK